MLANYKLVIITFHSEWIIWIVLIAILNLIQRSQNQYAQSADFVIIAEISPVCITISISMKVILFD